MTKTEGKTASAAVKDILLSNPDWLREVIRTVMQEVLEAEMDEALGAAKGERTPERLGYRSGHYGRTLITRVGKLELRVTQDRSGQFSTELFERYQRSERPLVATLAFSQPTSCKCRKSIICHRSPCRRRLRKMPGGIRRASCSTCQMHRQ
ncbi:transposase-like protein [Sinorhizobium medicae]